MGLGDYLFIFFLCAALPSAYGFIANLEALPYSRIARFLGAALGFFIWFFISAKLFATGNYTAEGLILGIPAAFYGEFGTMFYAAANLPRPGAPGNTGVPI